MLNILRRAATIRIFYSPFFSILFNYKSAEVGRLVEVWRGAANFVPHTVVPYTGNGVTAYLVEIALKGVAGNKCICT